MKVADEIPEWAETLVGIKDSTSATRKRAASEEKKKKAK